MKQDKEGQKIYEDAKAFVRHNNQNTKPVGTYSSPRVSSEIPDCSLPLTFDQHNHCSLACSYCFAFSFKENSPSIDKMDLKAANGEAIADMIRGKPRNKEHQALWDNFFSKRFMFHWGGMADPFDVYERKNGTAKPILEALAETKYPTLFSFKGDTIMDPWYREFFEKHAADSNFAFQVSIVTNDDELSKKVEVGVPVTSRRLAVVKWLSSLGYYTVLRLRPFIIGVSDQNLPELLNRALEAGIGGISTEFFAMDSRCAGGMRKQYDWLGKQMGLGGFDGMFEYYKKLSPSSRGGNLRLNRDVKEPIVRTIYDFSQKHNLTLGISDPDFKELNSSGSCCAMPDEFPKNPEMTNWGESQLTNAVKEARLQFHTEGEAFITFGSVYGPEKRNLRPPRKLKEGESTYYQYFDDPRMTNYHIYCIGIPTAHRRTLSQRDILRDSWNNLKSPANPQNYLHGKVVASHLDDNGDFVYKYVEHPYEKQWKKEGINLGED